MFAYCNISVSCRDRARIEKRDQTSNSGSDIIDVNDTERHFHSRRIFLINPEYDVRHALLDTTYETLCWTRLPVNETGNCTETVRSQLIKVIVSIELPSTAQITAALVASFS